jgi:REP element-mobilizing transposase RayT
MNRYDRRLPHFSSIDEPVFVTFRLHGSLPANRIFPPAKLTAGEAFIAVDRILDAGRQGPVYLRQPELAALLVNALKYGDERLRRYELHAFVVMPNHVHVLATSRLETYRWVGPLKGFTAREGNQLLGRNGPFWQDESYDHIVRYGEEFRRIQRYIEFNPVKAGLCATPEEFSWSSATPGGSPAAG